MNTKTLLAAVIITGIGAPAHGQELIKKWETEPVFKVPESVLFDRERSVLYVSNIGADQPWANDGTGSIGRLGLDGTVLEVEWVTGLNSPKGMGLHNGRLYVADNNVVAVIDVESGSIIERLAIESSVNLNDVSVDGAGVVYVSDSGANCVYAIRDGEVSTVVEGLRATNGVLAHGDEFYLLDNGGLYRLEDDGELTLLADGMEGFTDGVEHLTGSEFIVSTWAGVVYHVNASTGAKKVLLDGRDEKINAADIGLDPATRTVFVPTFFVNTVAAYEVR